MASVVETPVRGKQRKSHWANSLSAPRRKICKARGLKDTTSQKLLSALVPYLNKKLKKDLPSAARLLKTILEVFRDLPDDDLEQFKKTYNRLNRLKLPL